MVRQGAIGELSFGKRRQQQVNLYLNGDARRNYPRGGAIGY